MSDLTHIFYMLPGFIVGLTVHEFSHAYVADRLGDSTSRNLGRLTLNPLAHLDLFGSIMLVVAGFGWAKPVPVDLRQLASPKRDMAIIAVAGPVSNVMIAALCGILIQFLSIDSLGPAAPYRIYSVWINVVLAVFNMIPVPPLDGSRILAGIVPESMNGGYHQFERVGPFLLLGLVLLASFTGVSILGRIVSPLARPLVNFLIGGGLA